MKDDDGRSLLKKRTIIGQSGNFHDIKAAILEKKRKGVSDFKKSTTLEINE
jgi:hypothetical protein